jgi:cell division protein FtsB
MIEKLKNIQDLRNHPRLKQFRDVRAVGLLIFLGVALMVSWSGAKVIQRNYELQKEISHLDQQNAVSELENNNLKLQNQYYNTDQYLDLKARQDFGKGLPGETLLLVPQDVALSYVTKPAETKQVATPESQRPAYQRNFQAWIDFFLHRQGNVE